MLRNRVTLFAAASLVAVAACAPKAPPPPDTAADVALLKQLQDHEMETFASGNIDSIMANFADDIVMMAPDAPRMNGKPALRAFIEGMLKEIVPSGRYTAAEVQMLGDVGIVTFEGELTATPKKGGKATTHTIKGVHIFKKQADGSWKISQDVYSNDPATAK